MPQITDQARLLRENTLVFVSKGPSDGMWRCDYLKCPECDDYVLKGSGYDRCSCGNVLIDSDMLRVSVVRSAESEVECFNAVPRVAEVSANVRPSLSVAIAE
jgi:hypothetical protein